MSSDSKSHRGCLLLVIGASGVGKDSVLKAVQAQFNDDSNVHFLTRVITRPCIPENEIHDSLTEADFIKANEQGEFAVTWHANGNYYGLPKYSLDKIDAGVVVVANGSRGALEAIKTAYANKVEVVLIQANHATINQRLNSRSRDSEQQIAQRLQRNVELDIKSQESHTIINNDGPLEDAVQALSDFLTSLLPSA